jgi:hypothetical protein
MFIGREKETSPAAQVALIGDIIDGTADIQMGNPFITLVPVFIQK